MFCRKLFNNAAIKLLFMRNSHDHGRLEDLFSTKNFAISQSVENENVCASLKACGPDTHTRAKYN